MRRFPVRRLADCHTVDDFRELARRKLPYPVFHYIDGAADDELTRARNTAGASGQTATCKPHRRKARWIANPAETRPPAGS